jgi:putative endonuclease
VGVTSNLRERIAKHKIAFYDGFPKKYHCTDLLYYEVFEDMENAILREKQIKKYRREKFKGRNSLP